MRGIKAALNRLPLGEYCFASRWSDGSPMDSWQVGFLDGVIFEERDKVAYRLRDVDGNKGRWFRYCRQISKEDGELILSKYRSGMADPHITIGQFLKRRKIKKCLK